MKPRRGKRRTRRTGYALVLFVMMFFGLMGLAALVIDMGFARLTQRQMQTAVDSAALEGLRWRDVTQLGDLPQGWLADPNFQAEVGDPSGGTLSAQQWEKVPRWAASQVIADGTVTQGSSAQPSMFASYVDSGGTVSYGAGPVVNFSSGGVGPADLTAGQTITWPPPPPYQPTRSDGTPGLELNTSSNAEEGDMRAGQYGLNNGGGVDSAYPTQAPADEGGNLTDPPNYNRRDFFQPQSGTVSNAFLVRMRRTVNSGNPGYNTSNNTSGLDQEDGISSAGPTLPVLFGRGSMMARSAGAGSLTVASGVTVRATAIAAAGTATGLSQAPYEVGRALTVGRPNAAYSVPGSLSAMMIPTGGTGSQLYYVVIYLSQWKSFLPTSQTTLVVGSNMMLTQGTLTGGTLTNGTTTCGYVADGSAVDSNDVSSVYPNGRPFLGPAAMVGDQANIPAALVTPGSLVNELASELSPGGIAYVPIIDDTGDSTSNPLFDRVVGFGYVSGVQLNGTNASITFTVGSSGMIASQNVSATLGVVLPNWFADPALGPTRTEQIFTGYSAGADNLILAPVLVNHYIGPGQ